MTSQILKDFFLSKYMLTKCHTKSYQMAVGLRCKSNISGLYACIWISNAIVTSHCYKTWQMALWVTLLLFSLKIKLFLNYPPHMVIITNRRYKTQIDNRPHSFYEYCPLSDFHSLSHCTARSLSLTPKRNIECHDYYSELLVL